MVKKNKGKGQQKTKVTLSLFDFNKDATVGTDVALAALPTAPKAAEEWEAEGGRPEYNSRGYRERRVDPYADAPRDLDDDEFDNRVWARRGPLDSGADSGFGAGPERDWNGARRGPLDDSSAAQPERDWGGTRRGPVEADESAPPRDWGGARRGPVDADLPPPLVERDWTARKGPVDADLPSPAEQRDWTSRKGPVEAELPAAHTEPDWTARKGPVEAEIPQEPKKQDWGAARRAPVEAEAPVVPVQERDWSTRKGPVEPEVPSAQAPLRQVDFGNARRAPVEAVAPQQERPLTRAVSAPAEPATPAQKADVQGSSNWRRSAQPSRGERPASGGGGDWGGLRRAVSAEDAKPQRRTDAAPPRRAGPHMQQRRLDNAQEASGKDSAPARDWGAARRAQPPAENQPEPPKVTIETDGEWTTVRTENRRRGSQRSRPPHQQKQAPLRQAAAQVAEKVHAAETGHTVA